MIIFCILKRFQLSDLKCFSFVISHESTGTTYSCQAANSRQQFFYKVFLQ